MTVTPAGNVATGGRNRNLLLPQRETGQDLDRDIGRGGALGLCETAHIIVREADIGLKLLRHQGGGSFSRFVRDDDITVPSIQLAGVAAGGFFASRLDSRQHLCDGGVDIGLVGFPNAGKSSLTTKITKARPKTAAYPFTTLHPQIRVIEFPKKYDRLLLADVPGLIEGASENRGLGHRFLRHIERCALLMFLIDMAGVDNRDPRDDYATLVKELKLYDPALLKKPRLVVANKMDLEGAKANLAKFTRRHKVDVIQISCLDGTGLEKLKDELRRRVRKIRPAAVKSPSADL